MSIAYEIHAESRLIAFRLIGDFVVKDFRVAWAEILRDPLFFKGMNALWDLRAGTLATLTRDGVFAGRGAVLEMIDQRGGKCKVALLVAADFEYGMVKMMEILCENGIPFEVRAFRDYDESLSWLGESAPAAADG